MTKATQTLYVGYFVAGGKLRDLATYHSLDCARDTVKDSIREARKVHGGHLAITEAAVARIDDDGSWEVVETLDLSDL